MIDIHVNGQVNYEIVRRYRIPSSWDLEHVKVEENGLSYHGIFLKTEAYYEEKVIELGSDDEVEFDSPVESDIEAELTEEYEAENLEAIKAVEAALEISKDKAAAEVVQEPMMETPGGPIKLSDYKECYEFGVPYDYAVGAPDYSGCGASPSPSADSDCASE